MAIIDLRRGDALSLRVTLSDTDNPSRDWSAWEVEADISFSNCPPIELTTTWLDHPGGVAKVKITAEESADLQHLGDYKLRVRLTDPDGDPISTKPETVRVAD